MERFFFWSTIFLWLVVGGIAAYRGESIPPANVWSTAGCFIWLYFITQEKRGG